LLGTSSGVDIEGKRKKVKSARTLEEELIEEPISGMSRISFIPDKFRAISWLITLQDFHQYILTSPYRTLDPENADIFYVS
jgi:hypothetical protein